MKKLKRKFNPSILRAHDKAFICEDLETNKREDHRIWETLAWNKFKKMRKSKWCVSK